MQQVDFENSDSGGGIGFPARAATALALLAAALAAGGCNPAGEAAPPPPPPPFAGATVRLGVPDPRLADLLTPYARIWASRTGATVRVSGEPLSPGVDVGVIPAGDLGALADRGEILAVPAPIREPGHPYQWAGVFQAFRGEGYAGWGGRVFALPLAGPGDVVVYRTDRLADPAFRKEFEAKFGRPPGPPATWEDFADLAGFLADRDKAPSLPPLPADPDRLVTLFCRVASCYDRPAAGEGGGAPRPAAGPDAARREVLGFQFRTDDGRPRLADPRAGFGPAAEWLAGLKARGALPAGGDPDPAAALAGGRAVLAVASLDDLRRLRAAAGKDFGRYAVAPLPGTRGYVDPGSGKLTPTPPNTVPHIAGGWVGVVRAGCPYPDAAWDLLTELGGPTRSQELVAAGGYGPFRDAHLDRDRPAAWLGYGLDAARTRDLAEALRANVGRSVRNATGGLRGPDRAALTTALAAELRRVAAGELPPADGLRRAAAAWDEADRGVPPATLTDWRRKAIGLN